MPQLIDLCSDITSMTRLQEIYREQYNDEKRAMEEERQKAIRDHKEKHCFDSYEQALDWLVEHPDKRIEWHCMTLQYIPDENNFLSHEQEFSYDGVMAYDVTKKYTREELLKGIQNFIDEMSKDCPKPRPESI